MPTKYQFILSLFVFFSLQLSSCKSDIPESISEEYEKLPAELDFNIHVKPILSDKCFACHGPDKGKIEAGLQLHSSATAYGELPESPGKFAIVPGKLAESEMFRRFMSKSSAEVMPPPEFKITLTDHEKAVLTRWIKEGAEYEPHWAFVKPKEHSVPRIKNGEWARNAIDNFIAHKLDEKKLVPSKEADKSLLLRRLSLDLTGLPPTVDELEAFLKDDRGDAYERQVDRLLASPNYGEKMGTDWLDLARYADTYGYQVDFYRDMSPWRDWVIQSFNENMPYDQFITWQLAGDLLPNPTKEQHLATGFNRLHPQNSEDGIVEEEYRVEHVVDRTSVMGQGIMGLTVGCARCHDHKYDPISQKEFYELYSFFNNVNESGQISRDPMDMPVPTLLIPDKKKEELLAYLASEIENKETEKDTFLKNNSDKAEDWLASGAYKSLQLEPMNEGKEAHFSLDGTLKDKISGKSGKMARMYIDADAPTFAKGNRQRGILMNGDSWLDLSPVGIYKRNDPFSISLGIIIPDSLNEGVIFQKNMGVRLHGFKGYHLYYRDNQLEMMLAHTWPDNAIEKRTVLNDIPKGKWIQLTMTYDGSSRAEGLHLFLNGRAVRAKTVNDNLYKDIVFNDYKDVIYPEPIEPGLKIGGRWRGLGMKGAIVKDVMVYSRQLSALEALHLFEKGASTALLQKNPEQLVEEEKTLLKTHYLTRVVPEYGKLYQELTRVRQALVDSVEDVQEVMVMKEMEEPRQAYILERGQYDNHGKKVYPNTPSTILVMPEDLPRNRLGLAQWLTHPDHPLTARVAVNRYWQHLFGRGLVKTSEDFGNQGELPSHPRLLDHLAIDFMKSGWDVKALHKKIVMSATYRQSSLTTKELREMDPENVLLARGPSMRLSSEMIRDNALAASGLLIKKIGGQSVRPYQPPGLWKMNSNTYVQDTGENLYRRSLYTIWKRSVPFPTQATFDQPDRNECTVKRQKTNTPLQALVLLNDPTFIEVSRKIGEQLTLSGNSDGALAQAFVRLTGRFPMEDELKVLKDLRLQEFENFNTHPVKMKGWLESGQYRIDTTLNIPMVAANAVVASVIINTDAFITKR